jgi:hypothetical protein
MKESVMRADDPNEISVQFWPLKIAAKGIIAIFIIALPLAAVLLAVAWRIIG